MGYERNVGRPEPRGGKVSAPSDKGVVCAQPNCAYFCERRDDDRILKLRHAYAEYVDACDEAGLIAYAFSTFCAKLREWRRGQLVTEQPDWLPGECMLTYWSLIEFGGVRHWAFVAQMAFGDATFVCRSDGRSPRHWMACCERAYRYFGGVPHITDCSVFGVAAGGVTRCVRATLQGFAEYYRTVLFGARPKTTKTAKVASKPLGPKNSSEVLRAIRRDIAAAVGGDDDARTDQVGICNDEFIAERLEYYNKRKYVGAHTRWDLLVERELPRMLALPDVGYDMGIWDFRVVGGDYHFTLAGAKYSVPYGLAGQEVRIRHADDEVVAYHGGIEVARHALIGKDFVGKRVVTVDAHRPNGHRWFARRMDFRFKEMAAVCGDATVKVMEVFLERCKAEGCGYRACKELIDLRHVPSAVSLEEACARVIGAGADVGAIDIDVVRAAMEVA